MPRLQSDITLQSILWPGINPALPRPPSQWTNSTYILLNAGLSASGRKTPQVSQFWWTCPLIQCGKLFLIIAALQSPTRNTINFAEPLTTVITKVVHHSCQANIIVFLRKLQERVRANCCGWWPYCPGYRRLRFRRTHKNNLHYFYSVSLSCAMNAFFLHGKVSQGYNPGG